MTSMRMQSVRLRSLRGLTLAADPPPAEAPDKAKTVVLIAGLVALAAVYNQWAYGDWTCVIKHCVQTSSRR